MGNGDESYSHKKFLHKHVSPINLYSNYHGHTWKQDLKELL